MTDGQGKSPRFISTDHGLRAAQACDRCRIKKTRCDGASPCSKCVTSGFECTVSDKLARRSFPKGYTVNLEKRVKELEKEIKLLKSHSNFTGETKEEGQKIKFEPCCETPPGNELFMKGQDRTQSVPATGKNKDHLIQINNPIDQIFNLDENGIIIGTDNLNFESQLNHLLINLKLPFLKITNSHNYLLDDPNSYLFHRSYSNYNNYYNKDLEVIYNPLTMKGLLRDDGGDKNELPVDVYDLFIKLVNNFKKLFNSKKELDHQITQFFLNYNTFIPIFEYELFMQGYDAFHTMYPFMFTYDDTTLNGFNLPANDYLVVNEYLVVVVQVYAMVQMNDPSLNLNLLLNHRSPNYSFSRGKKQEGILMSSFYDFLPYLNVFHVSVNQLHTYLLFFYYSLITNNKEKSLVLLSLINAFIGILGVNLNCDNLFFNDLSLTLSQRRDRVKIFWAFKILLKCFNLKFGFKPTINTTVINPVTIEQYFRLTPEKLSLLLNPSLVDKTDSLFETLLSPSVEFLNLMNIVIPSSFSPDYYEYLKRDRQGDGLAHTGALKKGHTSHLDWIMNDDDGDGNDGNLNYNYNQFLSIDKNLSNWRYSLQEKKLNTASLQKFVGLSLLSSSGDASLYYRITCGGENIHKKFGISQEGLLHYFETGLADINTATQLIKIQFNFHFLLIRSMNYLNFVIEHELSPNYYVKIANISREVLAFFLVIFQHVGHSHTEVPDIRDDINGMKKNLLDPFPSDFDMDDDEFIRNDFSARRRKKPMSSRIIPMSPFNSILNGLSLTMINFKKVIVLQMLYLLICNLKISKRGGSMSSDTLRILNDSIALFIKIFINYLPHAIDPQDITRVEEFQLFKRIINDELKEEVLNGSTNETDIEDEEENEIDWDDENMDEDLKYLKILKYITYKTNALSESIKLGQKNPPKPVVFDKMVTMDVSAHTGMAKQENTSMFAMQNLVPSSLLVQFSPGIYTPDPNTAPRQSSIGSSVSYNKLADNYDSACGSENREERGLANDLISMRNGELRHN